MRNPDRKLKKEKSLAKEDIIIPQPKTIVVSKNTRKIHTRSVTATQEPSYEEEFPDDSDSSDDEFPYKIEKTVKKGKKGGKSVKNMGAVLSRGSYSLRRIPKNQSTLPDSIHFCYAVVVVKRLIESRLTQEFIYDYSHQLLPHEEAKQRLAIVIGENERETLDMPDDDLPDTPGRREARKTARVNKKNEIEHHYRNLNIYEVATVIAYFCWQANWINRKTSEKIDIKQVNEEFFKLSSVNPSRAHRLKRYECKRAHFPFGEARTFLYNLASVQKLFQVMKERTNVHGGAKLYLVNQDSDYIELNHSPIFYPLLQLASTKNNMLSKTLYEIKSSSDAREMLLEKCDKAIKQFHNEQRRYPEFFGGGHNYSPNEDLPEITKTRGFSELDINACKMWTRFGSELGNAVKHLIGQYNPYGLYFHEPFTIHLWQSNRPIKFGPSSEMQDYSRKKLKNNRENTKDYAKYHAGMTLTSSQKRAPTEEQFLRKFKGQYYKGKFYGWSCQDICQLQDMPQEIFTSNEWANVIATSYDWAKKITNGSVKSKDVRFTSNMQLWNLKCGKPWDARSVLAWLYNLYDPHYMTFLYEKEQCKNFDWQEFIHSKERSKVSYSENTFYFMLNAANYKAQIPDNNSLRKKQLSSIQEELVRIYGNECSDEIIAIAKQTGELRQMMFAAVMAEPKRLVPKYDLAPKKRTHN